MLKYIYLSMLIVFVTCFCACSNNKPVEQTFGELDKMAVAIDTAMEINMDHSYEYQTTLVESDSVVYDFLAYDRPMYGDIKKWEAKFHIIRRTSSTQDTIVKGARALAVQSIWLCDMNHTGRKQIMFYEARGHDIKSQYAAIFYAYETNGRHKANKINTVLKEDVGHYTGGDTFYVAHDMLIRHFPYFQQKKDVAPAGVMVQSYKLLDEKLVLEGERLMR